MNDEADNPGGEKGASSRNPSRLRSSELALLRRVSDRFPFTAEDRIRAVNCINDCVSDPDAGWRNRIAGVKTMAALERINLDEVGMAMDAAPTVAGLTVNQTTVVNQVAATIQAAQNDPAYLIWLESQRLAANRDAGAVRWTRQPESLADGPSPLDSQPTIDAGFP